MGLRNKLYAGFHRVSTSSMYKRKLSCPIRSPVRKEDVPEIDTSEWPLPEALHATAKSLLYQTVASLGDAVSRKEGAMVLRIKSYIITETPTYCGILFVNFEAKKAEDDETDDECWHPASPPFWVDLPFHMITNSLRVFAAIRHLVLNNAEDCTAASNLRAKKAAEREAAER